MSTKIIFAIIFTGFLGALVLEIKSIRYYIVEHLPHLEIKLEDNEKLVWIIFFMLVFFIGIPFLFLKPYPHHEGSILCPAYLMNYGYKPLQDVTMQHPPIIAYLYGWGFRLFGEYLIVSRFITLFATSVIILLIARLSKYFLPIWTSILLALFNYFGSGLLWRNLARPWSHTWSLLCILISVFILSKWLSKRKQYLLVMSGACLGFAMLFRLNYGVLANMLLFAATFTIVFREINLPIFERLVKSLSEIILLIISSFIVFAAVALIFYSSYGSAEPFIFLFKFSKATVSLKATLEGATISKCLGINIYGLCASVYFVFLYAVLSRGKLIYQNAYLYLSFIIVFLAVSSYFYKQLFFNLGFIIIGVAIIFNYLEKSSHIAKNQKNIFLLLIAMSLGLWLSMYPSKSIGYAMIGLSVLSGIMFFHQCSLNFRETYNKSIIFRKSFLSILFILLLLYPVFMLKTAKIFVTSRSWPSFSNGFYRYMKVDDNIMKEYSSLKSYIEQNSSKDDKILIWKIMSLQYVFLNRLPATLPYISLDNMLYLTPMGKDIDMDLCKKLDELPPKYVICDVRGQNKFNGGEISLPQLTVKSFPLVERFITNHYAPVWKSPLESYLILKYL